MFKTFHNYLKKTCTLAHIICVSFIAFSCTNTKNITSDTQNLETEKPLVTAFLRIPLTKQENKQYSREFNTLTKTLLKNMTEEQLIQAAGLAVKLKYFEEAIKYLEKVHTLTQNPRTAQTTLLTMADIYFEWGNFKKSGEKYLEYVSLYSSDKHTEYAQYKGLLSNFYIMLSLDRDQTATYNTIKLAEGFLEKSEHYKCYIKDVREIHFQCYTRLYDHDLSIFEYYFKRKRFKAAEIRLKKIKKEYQKTITDFEPKTLYLELRLALAQQENYLTQKLEQKLTHNFPHYSLKLTELEKTSKNLMVSSAKNKKNFFAFL